MRTSRLRVLHVIASLSPVRGGTTSSVVQMIDGLVAKGVTCEVATSDDDGPGRRLAADAPERQLRDRHYFPRRHELYTYTPSLGRWLNLRVNDYDLIHVHGLFSYVNGLAGRVCRRKGVPYIVTPHGMANRYGMQHKALIKWGSFALVEKELLNRAAAVHVTSVGEQLDFADLRIDVPTVHIPLAVAPVPPGDRVEFRNRYPEAASRVIAIFMGRLDPVKNLESVIDALAMSQLSDVHLIVCGEGSEGYEASLKNRARGRRVDHRISWPGFVSGQKKADLLATADVYVQPSLSESFGLAALEAVSAGLPCVLGKNVAIAGELVDAGFAIAVAPTPSGVSGGMEQALILSRKSNEFVKTAQRYVAVNFAIDAIALRLHSLYQKVCFGEVGAAGSGNSIGRC